MLINCAAYRREKLADIPVEDIKNT